MTKQLLRLNFLFWKKQEDLPSIGRYIIFLVYMIPIGILLIGGSATKMVGLPLGMILLILKGLQAFGIGKE